MYVHDYNSEATGNLRVTTWYIRHCDKKMHINRSIREILLDGENS